MIQLNRTFGNGTKPNKKHRGNRTDREALEPRQSTNAPIHHTTRANILIESCISAGSEDDQASVEQAIKIAVNQEGGTRTNTQSELRPQESPLQENQGHTDGKNQKNVSVFIVSEGEREGV